DYKADRDTYEAAAHFNGLNTYNDLKNAFDLNGDSTFSMQMISALMEPGSYLANAGGVDFWTMNKNGDLIEDGDGWLRDQNGNYKLDKNGNKIGAAGIETGLLNILNGGTSGVAYSEFTDEQILAAQGLMTSAGFRPSSGDSPRTFMWTKGNDGISIGSNSILSGFGNSVGAPVLMNGLDALSDSVVNGDISAFFSHNSVPSKAQSRFSNYLAAKMNFYGGTHQLLSSGTLLNSRISGWFGPDGYYPDGQHKGGDVAANAGKNISGDAIYAYYGGKVVGTRSVPESTSSGNSVIVEHGFNFEDYFYSTGVQSQYMHMLNTPTFNNGVMVNANSIMGNIGNTGDSTGTHLHWQLMGDRAATSSTSSNWNMYSSRRDMFLSQVGGIPSSEFTDEKTDDQNYWAEKKRYKDFYFNVNPVIKSWEF
ncbi:MAG: M23 family metallopeptidase, partial [Spirochaetales bacterium]|nr:M23 family metallopeptidase [Spirochaetales bacterium]